MNTFLKTLRGSVLALLLVFGLAACDSSTSALSDDASSEDELELLAAELTTELALSVEQQAVLDQTMSRFGDGDAKSPGFLWELAAQLSDDLTAEQKEQLLARAATPPQPRDGQDGMRDGQGGRRGGPGGHGGPGGYGDGGDDGGRSNPLADILTEDQLASIEALREARKVDVEAARAAVRAARDAGDQVAAAAAHDALKVLMDEIKAEVEAWLEQNLSDDQKTAVAELKAAAEQRRLDAQAAERAAMVSVLTITDETVADGIIATVEAFKEAARALDPTSATFADDWTAAFEQMNSDVDAVLADGPFEVFQIHHALASRPRKGGRRGGPGGPGGPGGGGNFGQTGG